MFNNVTEPHGKILDTDEDFRCCSNLGFSVLPKGTSKCEQARSPSAFPPVDL